MSDKKAAMGIATPEAVYGTRVLFDSAESGEFSSAAKAGKLADVLAEKMQRGMGAGAGVSQVVADFLTVVPQAQQGVALDAVTEAREEYKAQHGYYPNADTVAGVLMAATGMAKKYTQDATAARRHAYVAADDASASASYQSNTFGLAAGPVITTVFQLMAEEMPFAGRLPAESGAGTFSTGILHNIAVSNFGAYSQDDSIDGLNGWGEYIDAQRVVTLSTNGGGATAFTGTVKTKNGGSTALPFLVGHTEVRVNGIPIASDFSATLGSSSLRGSGSGSYGLSGTVTIAGTTYTLTSSTITPSTGAYAIQFNAALPANTVIELVVVANYENNPDLAPIIGADVEIQHYQAVSSRAKVQATIEAYQQASAELGLDIFSAGNNSTRAKFLQERYLRALKQLRQVGANVPGAWNMDMGNRKSGLQQLIPEIVSDLVPEINRASQKLANNSQDTGAEMMYATGLMATYIQTLPPNVFTPSGIAPRPGIYRMGRWLSTGLDVYFLPEELGVLANDDNAGESELLLLRRGSSTARAPWMVADAVAPTLLPLADSTGGQMRNFFYTKSFSGLNKSLLFRNGAARIAITGMKS